MPRRPSAIAPIALVLGIGLTLSACSAIGGAPELDPEKSPLAEYMSAFYGEQDQDFYDEQAKKTEELVAECMNDDGWEYLPVDQTQYSSGVEYDAEERNTEKWVATYGYGVNLTQEEQEEMYGSPEEYVDPNQEYVSSLSETENIAYYAALYGPGPSEEDMNEDGSYEYNWEDGGCYGKAQHEVTGEQAYDQDQFKPIFDAMGALYEDQSKDPRMKELDADWASCMADAGYTEFKAKQDAAQSIYDQQNEFWENNPTGEAPTDEQTKEWRETEIDVALADFTCGEKLDYTQKQLAVQFELEEQFIKDHKAELDELVAFQEKNAK
jgi:hypothetical protein